MRVELPLAFVLFAVAGRALAQATAALEPAAFEREVRAWAAEQGASKVVLAVMHESRLVLNTGFGGADPGVRSPVWSLSKAITAACIGQLIKMDSLRLEDTLEDAAPRLVAKFSDRRVRNVRVDQLLAHRAGWARMVGDNLFSPDLAYILSRHRPASVQPAMLMAEIFKLHLATDPGERYEYSNVGYLVLGRLVEEKTGLSYETACGESVLKPAGIQAPNLDGNWGKVLDSAGGWGLTAAEYLAFMRFWPTQPGSFNSLSFSTWALQGDGAWLGSRKLISYSAGLMVRHPEMNLFHAGSWHWRQGNAAGGALQVDSGSLAVLTKRGTGWVVKFEGIPAPQYEGARKELDSALWRAMAATKQWPTVDLFEQAINGSVRQ